VVEERDQEDLPSSALIENDLTEICITVGFVAAVEAGRLFARTSVSDSFSPPRCVLARSRQPYKSEWCHLVIYARRVGSEGMTERVVGLARSNLSGQLNPADHHDMIRLGNLRGWAKEGRRARRPH
jgi:hypothetical protein